MTARQIRRRAKELALSHGGKMAYARPGEGMMVNAYLAGCAEGWWSYGRGVHTPELLDLYMGYHWRDFLRKAAQELNH